MSTGKIGIGSIIAYGVGSVAYGIKENGFSTFLMIYFNQVLGLPAYLVGVALLIAMLFDAVSDPWVGYLSDRHSSRMGRRHPFMYASIIPIALTYFWLWNPPAVEGFALFAYLTAMAVIVRLAITFFEVPNSALIGEISHDYDKRTAITGLRLMFGWIGGVVMAVVVYRVFLPDSVDYDPGILNPEGYQDYALVAAIVMVIAMLISSLGTHRAAMHFSKPDRASHGYEFNFLGNIRHIFANISFRSVFIAALFANLVAGVIATLQLYFGVYYFGLSTAQLALVTLTMVPAAVIAYLSAAFVVRGRDKKSVALALSWAAMVLSVILVIAKYFDLLPPEKSSALFYIIAGSTFVTTTVAVLLSAVTFSMIIDLVDEDQTRTGHRAEGLYFATFSFTRKVVTGFGIFVSGVMLSLGEGTGPAITHGTMQSIAPVYVVIVIGVYLLSIAFLRRYRLTRADHRAALAAIGKATGA
ncbi:MAG: Na+/melibiose symporter-like transporter [Paracoccaceae bacterium]|jgi:GPH family glycoside/pentoside/hexuronide:cation symporter